MRWQMRFSYLQKLWAGQDVEEIYRPGLIRTSCDCFLLLL
jgi:hypothetical protein